MRFLDTGAKSSPAIVRKGGTLVNVLVFTIVACVVGFVSWLLLQHLLFKMPRNNRAGNLVDGDPVERNVNEPSAEDKMLIQKELDRRKALEDEKVMQQRVAENVAATEEALTAKKWSVAEARVADLRDDSYPLAELEKFEERIESGKDKESRDLAEVQELLDEAEALDEGNYSPEANDLVDKALLIYPGHPQAAALKKKLNAYPYTLRVPEDVASINDAVDMMRPGDTVILGEGEYQFPAMLDKGVIIKGQGEELTTIECDTTKTSAFTLTGKDQVYSLSDLTVKGLTYEDDALDRYPLILVDADLTMHDVTVKSGSGHGVAVVSGKLALSKCKISENAWDGVSVTSVNSYAEISDSEISGNYDHGVDFWDGASGKLTNVTANKNAGSGVLIMGQGAKVDLEQVKTEENSQCGIVINSQAEVQLERVVSSENRLSGVVLQGAGSKMSCGIVVANKNGEAGFLIDPEATLENFVSTTAEGNAGDDVIKKAIVFPEVPAAEELPEAEPEPDATKKPS